MKKNPKKLRLNRDTLAVLAGAVSAPANGFQAAIDTSCTYPCGCETGCSAEQACLGDNGAALR
jgi:hypothetical protein